MNLIRQVVLNRPRIVEAMKSVLSKAQRQQCQDDNSVPAMEKQIKRLRKQIAQISDQLTGDDEADDPIVAKIDQAKTEIVWLTTAIRLAGAEPRSSAINPQSNIERLADQLEKFGRTIDPSDVPLIRAVIELLVSRLEVDLDTKEFEIELAIPSWMGHLLQRPLPADKKAGLDECLACKPLIETHPENRAILGIFHCDGEGRPLCYTCHRQRKAA